MIAELHADAREGVLTSIRVTLAEAGTVTSIEVPDKARGARMFPAAEIRFAVNENPAAEASSGSTSISTSALAVGGIAKANEWETRLLQGQIGRTLRLRGAAGSEVVQVEFF